MRKIFIFWIVFLIVLIIGIFLAISSKSVLRREKNRTEELKKVIISRPSRLLKLPAVSEVNTEQSKVKIERLPKPEEKAAKAAQESAPAQPSLPVSSEIPPVQNNIPVEINTNALEISVPAPQSSVSAEEAQPDNTTVPLPRQ